MSILPRIARIAPTAALACMLLAFAPVEAAPESSPPFVRGEVIARLVDGVTLPREPLAGAVVRREAGDGQTATLAVPVGREREFAARLGGVAGVRYAELNLVKQPSFVPNDTEYVFQWNMRMVQAEEAWDITRGEGATIAVVDTGVAFENYGQFGRSPQLSQTDFVHPYDATTNSVHPNDDNGHGTHVTGTLAQDSNDGAGTAGLAPGAQIMPVKVCEAYGCASDAFAAGLRWAVDHGADVINVSLGGPGLATVEREALDYAEDNGVVVVAAAGNGGSDFVGDPLLDYPAAVPTVIAVGAVGVNEGLTPYSNYGAGEGSNTHVAAPGGNNSADLNHDGFPDGVLQNTYRHTCKGGPVSYTTFDSCFYQGTSMATPHVAAAVALLLSWYPGLTTAEVREVIACSAKDIGEPGDDAFYGAGLVQAANALRDTDEDGIVDCLERPAELTVTAGNATIQPGGEAEIRIDGRVDEGAIGGYTTTVLFDPDVVQVLECLPRPGGECVIHPDRLLLIGNSSLRVQSEAGGSSGITGAFRMATASFRAVGADGSQTALTLVAAGQGLSASDPPANVHVENGAISVRSLPETIPGDADCNGLVDEADVVVALVVAAGAGEAFCGVYADVDCSGTVEPRDVLALLTYLAGIEPSLPAGCA